MKLNVSMALRAAIVAVVSVASANAFAGCLFDCFNKNSAPVVDACVDDCSFFCEQSVVIGDMDCCAPCEAACSPCESAYQTCEVGESYACCFTRGLRGGVPAAVSYQEPVVTYVDSAPRGCFAKRRGCLGKREGRFLSCLKRFLGCKSYDYCQPAYVCDPCWTVCDPCWTPCAPAPCAPMTCAPAPCQPAACASACVPCDPTAYWTPAPCIPASCVPACAPASCCGNGSYPGQVNKLNPDTGLADASNDSANSNDQIEPSVPAYDDADDSVVPSYDSNAPADDAENVPTPQPNQNTGAGLIKMLVPEDSIVYVNGYRTKQTGALRTFAASNLEAGETYSFEIRVVAYRDGRAYEDVQTTTISAGDTSALAFNLTLRDNQAIAYK